MPLTPGTTLGPYAVTAKIGEGGMGEVYRARDTKLDRDVALKVLPQAFTDDPDRLARFEREAKVLASLNHPNIGHIYGLEEAEGTKALVLELVEGPTLADRIAQGPIPVDEALLIAKQIAEALEAAHEQGIIHRDLKPVNIKVKDDGTVKVLDFGLAKAFQPDASDPNMSTSPTISLTAAATQMGMVIGTAAYMAPEQAKGRPVDRRADVWAFGAVLFEMLTGRKPFPGSDVSDVLATVLKVEPDWRALPSDTPPSVRRLIRRCLSKDLKLRVRDVGSAIIELHDATSRDDDLASPAEALSGPPGGKTTLVVVALVATVVSGIAGWFVAITSMNDEAGVSRFSVRLPLDDTVIGGASAVAAVSPDGGTLIYIGDDGQLYRRELAQLDPIPIAGTSGAHTPFFSPDGEWVGFEVDGQLRKVSVAGGTPITLCPIPGSGLRGAHWGGDDHVVFSVDGVGLMRVSAAGGAPETLTTPDPVAGEQFHIRPHVLPDANAVLFTAWIGSTDNSRIEALSLETGERTVLVDGNNAHYLQTGHLVYARTGSLWAVPFSASGLQVLGVPVPVMENVWVGAGNAPQFSLSRSGTLLYVPDTAGAATQLTWVDLTGQETLVNLPPGDYVSARLSPDGAQVAVSIGGTGERGVWVSDVERNTLTRLDTTTSGMELWATWTPDGNRIVYVASGGSQSGLSIQAKSSDGTGESVRLVDVADTPNLRLWGPMRDEEHLAVEYVNGGSRDIGVVSLGGQPSISPLESTGAIEATPTVAPGGGWVAYVSNETGDPQVYVQRFPDGGSRQRVSTSGGTKPLWAPDGSALYYANLNSMMVASVLTENSSPAPDIRFSDPRVLFTSRFRLGGSRSGVQDISADGQRFLTIPTSGVRSQDDEGTDVVVVLNWHEELAARVSVD